MNRSMSRIDVGLQRWDRHVRNRAIGVCLGLTSAVFVLMSPSNADAGQILSPIAPLTLSTSTNGHISATADLTWIDGTGSGAISVAVVGQPGCSVQALPKEVVEDRSTPITFDFGAGCHQVISKISDLRVDVGGVTPVILEVNPSSLSPAPPWDLWLFVPAAAGAILIAVVAIVWRLGLAWGGLKKPLDGLDKNWSFSQSWAANLTATATIATGLFASSTILQGVLGAGSAPALTVMLVAGALATASAGAGTIITLTFRKGVAPYALAVVIAAIVTLTGSIGQLLIIGDTSGHLSLGSLHGFVWPIVAVACGLLACYGISSIRALLPIKVVHPAAASTPSTTRRRRRPRAGAGERAEYDLPRTAVPTVLVTTDFKSPEPSRTAAIL